MYVFEQHGEFLMSFFYCFWGDFKQCMWQRGAHFTPLMLDFKCISHLVWVFFFLFVCYPLLSSADGCAVPTFPTASVC